MITLVNGKRVGIGFSAAFVFAFPNDILKPDAARNTKLDTGMFHDES